MKRIHEVANPPHAERAVLVGHGARDGAHLTRSMDELENLAGTEGVQHSFNTGSSVSTSTALRFTP